MLSFLFCEDCHLKNIYDAGIIHAAGDNLTEDCGIIKIQNNHFLNTAFQRNKQSSSRVKQYFEVVLKFELRRELSIILILK